MKKFTAIIVAVIMIASALVGMAEAFRDNVFPEDFLWIATDQYAYAGNWLWAAGNSDDFVNDNLQTYEMHTGNAGFDIVGFYGWAAFKDADHMIATFGIKLDGGAMINSPLAREQDPSLDRRAEIAAAGVPNGEGFWLVFFYTDLGPGNHNAAFYAVDTDGKEYKMFEYNFKVVADGEWIGEINPGNAVNTGWWFNPVVPQPNDKYVAVTFTAKNSFNGIRGFYFCNDLDADHGPADMTVELIQNGKVVASGVAHGNANSWVDTDFGKTFGPGEYTLKYTCLDGQGAGKSWFVIGAANVGSGSATVESVVDGVTEGVVYPAIMLKTVQQQSEPSNPPSGDAAIIAIAAVGCIALAGVVVAKKVR